MNKRNGGLMGGQGLTPPDGRHEDGGVDHTPEKDTEARQPHHQEDRTASPTVIPCEEMPDLLVRYRFDEFGDDVAGIALRDAVAGHLAYCHDCHIALLALGSGLRVFARLAAEVGSGTDHD